MFTAKVGTNIGGGMINVLLDSFPTLPLTNSSRSFLSQRREFFKRKDPWKCFQVPLDFGVTEIGTMLGESAKHLRKV